MTLEDDLRGCIGNLGPLCLRKALPQYSLIAALEDDRFDPISEKELMELKVAVSLLVHYEDCKNALDWTVGRHGIIMEYMGRTATFLPEVASEQQWDQR